MSDSKNIQKPDDVQVVGPESPAPGKSLSFIRMNLIVSFSVAINFGWSVFFVLATPLFSTLGVSPVLNSFATASGPVCGFLQPFLGVYSDRCRAKMGRRRPFIIFGLAVGAVGMILFANCQNIGNWLTPTTTTAAVATGITSLWLFNIGLNFIQGAGMALMLDVCNNQVERDKITAFYTAAQGIAGILANFLGFVNFVAALPFFQTNYQAVFYIGIVVLLIFTLPTLIFANEVPLDVLEQRENKQSPASAGKYTDDIIGVPSPRPQPSENFLTVLKNMGLTLIRMNSIVFRIVLMYGISAASQYPWNLYYTDFGGQDVYKGNSTATDGTPAANAYNDGVRLGSLAMGFMGVVTFLASLPMAPLMDFFGYKAVYAVGHLWGVVSVGGNIIPQLQTPLLAIILCAIGGVFNAVTTAVPFALISLAVAEEHMGLYVGVMNMVQVASQLIAGALAGVIMQNCASWGLGQIAPGIAIIGGGFALIGIPFILWIKVPPKPTPKPASSSDDDDDEYSAPTLPPSLASVSRATDLESQHPNAVRHRSFTENGSLERRPLLLPGDNVK